VKLKVAMLSGMCMRIIQMPQIGGIRKCEIFTVFTGKKSSRKEKVSQELCRRPKLMSGSLSRLHVVGADVFVQKKRPKNAKR